MINIHVKHPDLIFFPYVFYVTNKFIRSFALVIGQAIGKCLITLGGVYHESIIATGKNPR